MSENTSLKEWNGDENSEENSTDQGQVVEEPNNSDDLTQKSEDEMPTLVAKIFIESVTDVGLLKKLRFICKYWNHEACLPLRKLSIISLTLSDGGKQLKDFLEVQNSGRSLSLPLPFKDASVSIYGLSKYPDDFNDLLNSSNLEIKSLFMSLHDVEDLEPLNVLLKSKETEITKVECTNSQSYKLHEAFSGVKFPCLQTLDIMDMDCEGDDDNFHHVELFRKVTMDSPLSNLAIRIHSTSCFSSFISMDLTRIEELDLTLSEGRFKKKHWDSLANVQLPSLKVLFLRTEEDLPKLYSFYKNVSSTVEEMEVNSEDGLFTSVYPKLKSLVIRNPLTSQDLNNITRERFPHLRDIGVTFSDENNLSSVETNPLERVRTLHAVYGVDDHDNNLNEDYRKITIATLAKKFPNVKNLRLQFQEPMDLWTSSELLEVYDAYPHLNYFSIGGVIPLEVLAGTTIQELTAEWPVQNFPRLLSIFDFQSLESLRVEKFSSDISNESIQYCFARIPNLKYLEFPWNRGLSVQVVHDFLQHLLYLKLSNGHDWRNILTDLRTVMPGTTALERNTSLRYLDSFFYPREKFFWI